MGSVEFWWKTVLLPLQGKFLLPPVRYQDMHKICLIIDLDETLVHSSIKVRSSCFVLAVPWVCPFAAHQQCRLRGASGDWWHSTPGVCPEEALRGRILQRVGDAYECVLFTASLAKVRPYTYVLVAKWRRYCRVRAGSIVCIDTWRSWWMG